MSRITNAIGVPYCVDDCTTRRTRVQYARALVKVNITRPLVNEVRVNGKSLED